ncbi:MAG TPA: peptide chain release factor N(5)-glutamine methyltransferase [Rhizomicrobium sp.]|nr:peptide chain release factor N(5)-glutamine methyltransferase [Rhizomicrobium sp.]
MSPDPVAAAARHLADAGNESARLDARLLWQFARDIEAGALVARGRAIPLFESLVARRLAHEPLAYILGRKEFWSLDFAVGPGVLIPRPDSETLIDALCKTVPNRDASLSILDLGTGSGALLIAALSEYKNAKGVGSDASAAALAWAQQNVRAHKLEARVELIEMNWLDQAWSGFDVILCNPPYVATADIEKLAPDVRLYEPHSALDGGYDGLDAYRALAPRIGKWLAPGGRAYLEIGAGQEGAVRRILESSNLTVQSVFADLAGTTRCVAAANIA